MSGLTARDPGRIDDLVALARATEPFADLSADELLLSCHERGGVVLGADGVGVVAVAIGRAEDGGLLASVRLLLVEGDDPDGASLDVLLAAAEDWATERSAPRILLGGGLPFSLVPGAPSGSAPVAAAVRRGYVVGDEWSSHRVPVTFRSDPPAGVVVRRAVRDEDVSLVLVAASANWPRRSDEIACALDHGTCHVAIEERDGVDTVVGISTHSIARAGWAGPILVVDDARRRGIGRAVLGQVCRDLMIAEFPHVIVADAATPSAQSFLDSVGAEPETRWLVVEKRLD